jgi:hypothetical protein
MYIHTRTLHIREAAVLSRILEDSGSGGLLYLDILLGLQLSLSTEKRYRKCDVDVQAHLLVKCLALAVSSQR